MARHSKVRELSPQQVKRILYDASRLHDSITAQSLHTGCEHYRALADLSEALVAASKAITGQDRPPWALEGSGHTGFFKGGHG